MSRTASAHDPGRPSGGGDLRPTTIPPLWLLSIGGGVALLFVGMGQLQAYVLHFPPDLRNGLIESFSRWLLYAALAPVIGVVVARMPLARGRDAQAVPVHLGATLGCALLHTVLVASIYGALKVYPRGSTLGEAVGRLAMVYFSVNFVIFWAIDGVYHALRYHDEVRARERLAAELRSQLTLAQLDGLRAQLNPHFLFNTLNTLSTLALTGEREEVVETLARLGDLLRVSLDRDLPQEIPLARELELVRDYLAIQQIRYGDRLSIEMQIEPDAEARLVPSMILQPLLENAIQHGVAAQVGPGRVVVRASSRGAHLCVRVEDSGPGFGAEPRREGGRGIGLANTRSRLAQLYGADGALETGNLEQGGGVVQLLVPARGPEATASA